MNSHSEPAQSEDFQKKFVKAAQTSDLPVGSMKRFMVEGHGLALANINGTVYAFEDRCLHWGVRLSDGSLEGNVVRCRAHSWKHDLTKGEVVVSVPPGDEGTHFTTFATKILDNTIWVSTEPNPVSPADAAIFAVSDGADGTCCQPDCCQTNSKE
jgi:nitrite reductase/ring-hydroxylating ferredoxin subunit